jgi:hypothetical protein
MISHHMDEKKAQTKAAKICGISETTLSRYQAVIGLVYGVALVLLVLFNSLSRQPFFNGAANEIGCIVLDKMTGMRNCE